MFLLGIRERLLPHAWRQRQVVDASYFVVFAPRTSVTKAEIDSFIALIARTRGVTPESLANYHGMMTSMLLSHSFRPIAVQWSARQADLALGNLLSNAALLGIDACPMEGFMPVKFDKVLGLPAQGLTVVVCCALGYRHPDDGNRPKDKASVVWIENNGGSPDTWMVYPIKWSDRANTRDPWIGEMWFENPQRHP